MPIINQKVLDVYTGYQTLFRQALESDDVEDINVIASTINSETLAEQYPALVGVPQMSEFVGEAEIQSLLAGNYTIQNKDYHATVGIPYTAYEDDKLGLYNDQIAAMGTNAKTYPWTLLVDILDNAFTAVDYTGKPFIAADKPYIPGVKGLKVPSFTNKGTKKLTEASLGEAIAKFKETKDPYGKALYAGTTFKPVLMVPSALEQTARKLVEKDTEGGNPLYGSCTIRVIVGLANQACWFLADLRRACKPFIYQKREEPNLLSNSMAVANGMEDSHFIQKHEILFQVKARGALAYGASSRIWGSDGSTAG